MRRALETVQKRIGLMVSFSGLIMIITNIVNRTIRVDFEYAMSGKGVWLLFLIIVPFIISIFLENRILKILQIAFLVLTGAINIVGGGYREFYGPGMFLGAWLLMRHYGFLEKYGKLKNVLFLVFLVGLSQGSAAIHSEESVYAGLTTLLYSLFLVLLLIIVWRDMTLRQQQLKKENLFLKTDYNKLAADLLEIELEQRPFDLKAKRITPAEERVIKILTLYKASNREIAERLGVEESTVKQHLHNIYEKMGVENRFAIIELCQYNFKKAK